MDTNQFWAIIEAGGPEVQDDLEHQLAAVRQAFLELPPDELIEFHRLFNRAMDDAYTWDLWDGRLPDQRRLLRRRVRLLSLLADLSGAGSLRRRRS